MRFSFVAASIYVFALISGGGGGGGNVVDAEEMENPRNQCDRGAVYSVATPNEEWDSHTFHPQVWYHSLEDTYNLWRAGYFDYVLDVRPVETRDPNLPGWSAFHIPGSFPLDMNVSAAAEDVTLLTDVTSDLCKDSRIFVHCWVGVAANMGANLLIQLGFTNVHAAGPEGDAGIFQWRDAGYDLVLDDEYDPKRRPKCWRKCRRFFRKKANANA